jgi:polysaccharide export outer membrane protein
MTPIPSRPGAGHPQGFLALALSSLLFASAIPRVVADSTLPAAEAPSSAATALPAAAAPVASVFEPGDTVRVSMVEDPQITFDGAVSVMGTVPLPYLREFRIAGLTPAAAEAALSQALCKDLYQTATVSVALIAKPPQPPKPPGKVYAYGAITKPGVVELPPNGEITAMQLVSEIGGLTSWAAPQKAYIMREKGPGQSAEKIPVDLAAVFSDTAPTAVVPFRDGDIFFVPGQAGSAGQVMTNDDCQIIIVGEVNAPGIIRFSPGEQRTIMRAIFKAAGFSKFAKDKAVRLIRYGEDGSRSEQTINVSEIIDGGFLDKDVVLLPGDMIIVPQKIINF